MVIIYFYRVIQIVWTDISLAEYITTITFKWWSSIFKIYIIRFKLWLIWINTLIFSIFISGMILSVIFHLNIKPILTNIFVYDLTMFDYTCIMISSYNLYIPSIIDDITLSLVVRTPTDRLVTLYYAWVRLAKGYRLEFRTIRDCSWCSRLVSGCGCSLTIILRGCWSWFYFWYCISININIICACTTVLGWVEHLPLFEIEWHVELIVQIVTPTFQFVFWQQTVVVGTGLDHVWVSSQR